MIQTEQQDKFVHHMDWTFIRKVPKNATEIGRVTPGCGRWELRKKREEKVSIPNLRSVTHTWIIAGEVLMLYTCVIIKPVTERFSDPISTFVILLIHYYVLSPFSYWGPYPQWWGLIAPAESLHALGGYRTGQEWERKGREGTVFSLSRGPCFIE